MGDLFNRVQLDSEGNEQGNATANEYWAEAEDGSREGGFRNQDALAVAVGDPRYANDSAYRDAVSKLVAKTSEGVLVGHQPKYDGTAFEECEQDTETITRAMQNPLYQTSAVYRRQVQAQIAASMSPRALRHQSGTDTGAHRVMLSSDASVDPMGRGEK